MDQSSFLWVRASGHVHAVQCVWMYPREVNIVGLQRFYDNLNHGLLGRRVERSVLPFGRHRWVSWPQPVGFEFARPRTRAEVDAWIEQRGRLPVDPEFGPSWHLGVLPITDYGSAVSLVVSHTVVDGMGLCVAIADAVQGLRRDFGYPPAGARRWRRAFVEDVGQFGRGLPQVGRAFLGIAKLARQDRLGAVRPADALAKPKSEADRPVEVPTATVYVDLADWDAAAERLGGSRNALFAGFAAKLAERLGRLRPSDRRVTLTYPVNDRTENDQRANALKGIDFTVDPASVTTDLRLLNEDLRQARASGQAKFEEQESVLPLNILMPKVVVRKLFSVVSINANVPVGCSYFGDLDPAVALPDGTAAQYVSIRLIEQNLTEQSAELVNGELYLSAGRSCGKVFIAVRCYQPGTANSGEFLRARLSDTLADFELAGVIE